jgi:hypothetical protein
VLGRDDATHQAVVTIHWNGGRHTELRVSRVRTGRYPADRRSSPVVAIRTLGGQLPDRELAVTLGRSGSGLVERPGFQKLVASVCSGSAGDHRQSL